MRKIRKVKIGIVGCGAIGQEVALFIDRELQSAVSLFALTDLDKEKAAKLKKKLKSQPEICDIEALIAKVDLVIETASLKAAQFILRQALTYRKDVVILSVGALIGKASLLSKLQRRNIKIYIPSGAICGVDGLGGLACGQIKKLSLVTSKPPQGLIGVDYLKKRNINLANFKKEKIIFKGRVNEAIKYFPKNINVSATLLLASGFKNVEVCIKADPKLKRNTHHIIVDAKEAKLNIKIENTPSRLNPKTSALAILSTQYLLKKMFSSFKIGS